jgi:hypothetical protein
MALALGSHRRPLVLSRATSGNTGVTTMSGLGSNATVTKAMAPVGFPAFAFLNVISAVCQCAPRASSVHAPSLAAAHPRPRVLPCLQVLFPVYTSARQAFEASPDFVEFRTFYKSYPQLLTALEPGQPPVTMLVPNNAVRERKPRTRA